MTHSTSGSISETANLPGVHAHWLLLFRLDDLDAALKTVRAHGGNVMATSLPTHPLT